MLIQNLETMSKIEQFEDLECWKAARQLTKHVFQICNIDTLKNDFDTKKRFKSAALSTMNNITEGFARYNNKDFIRFLDYAQSSASEVKSMTYVFEDLNLLNDSEIKKLREECDKVRNLTLGFIRYLGKSDNKNTLTRKHIKNGK